MTDILDSAVRKVTWRLMPFLMLLFFLSLLDRANISFAALRMNQDLGLSPQAYGFAAGVFFLGYVILGVPSNMALMRVGARRWLGGIAVCWGVVAVSMAWVTGANSLFALRFVLGAAEAGLLPGIMYYLIRWVPGRSRGSLMSLIMVNTTIAYVIGGPLSTWLMSLEGAVGGLHGWQLMFIIEGVPSVLVGLAAFFYLPETPRDAPWLAGAESDALEAAIAREQAAQQWQRPLRLTDGLLNRNILLAGLFSFFTVCVNFGTVFWLPQIIGGLGTLTPMEIGFLSTIPYALGGVVMVVVGRRSDRSGARRPYLVFGALLASSGFAIAASTSDARVGFLGLCIAAIGVWGTFGVIWAYSSDIVAGAAAVTGLAVINSIGNLGGFVGPALIGYVRSHSASFAAALATLSAFALLTALVGLCLSGQRSPAFVRPEGSPEPIQP